jgi:hypothetical protein
MWAWFRAPSSKTIVGTTLTIEGTGRYTILPASPPTGSITAIVVSQENVAGCFIELAPETSGHTITLVHGTGLRLQQATDIDLTTVDTCVWLRYKGSNVWRQASPVLYIP